jgi:hypothetical protein
MVVFADLKLENVREQLASAEADVDAIAMMLSLYEQP